jgi:hypothetical protein
MDSGVTLTARKPKPKVAPDRMDTVVVFGDSLSDIGKKWTSTTGQLAIGQGEMFVSPTGRFSDCRNWTDFMYEEATGATMIVDSAAASIGISSNFTTFSKNSVTPMVGTTPCFQYANYAEGGACGYSPAGMYGAVLGTFESQVNAFIKDCKTCQQPLGNTLFIIWFGANDLYTAKRKYQEMPTVAKEIAGKQRKILAEFVKGWNFAKLNDVFLCNFLFVDLCRPLTSVRYTKWLQDAEALVRTTLGRRHMPGARPVGSGVSWAMSEATNTLRQAKQHNLLPPSSWYQKKNIVELLEEQIVMTQNLEKGVLLYNATLKSTANANGDRVAEVGHCISEETLRRLVKANFRLKAGAMGAAVTQNIGSNAYDSGAASEFTTTVDLVHPTDQMYKLIWLEIREQIRKSNCTFGSLSPVPALTPLSTIQGIGPVMEELGSTPQARLRRTDHTLW